MLIRLSLLQWREVVMDGSECRRPVRDVGEREYLVDFWVIATNADDLRAIEVFSSNDGVEFDFAVEGMSWVEKLTASAGCAAAL